jgi:uncharacterized protein (UPF0548 family)
MARELRRLTPAEADRLRGQQVTYADVGLAAAGRTPPGFAALAHRSVLGTGPGVFDQAVADLFAWQVPLRSGISVRASSATVEPDAVARMVLGIGRFGVPAPVRIVAVVEEPGRRGFSYGTLPGHPESGEEFLGIVLAEDGTVALEIFAFSRPARWYSRLGAPVTRLVQAAVTRRYGRAIRPG